MRQLVLALAFCFAISPIAASTQTTKTVKVKKHKVKGHKAPKVKKPSKHAVKRGTAN